MLSVCNFKGIERLPLRVKEIVEDRLMGLTRPRQAMGNLSIDAPASTESKSRENQT